MPPESADVPCLLTIAGSDPSGGAGIQADIKTMTVLGCYTAAVITAITCQNSQGVSAVSPLSPSLVHDQIKAVLDDLPVSHIKIGMTATAKICAAIAQACRDFTGEIIFDPVMRASSGHALLQQQEETGINSLLEVCTVLTPNKNELASISGHTLTHSAEALQQGQHLFNTLPKLKAICVKGGHFNQNQQQITDFLLYKEHGKIQEKSVSHPRLATSNSHGTGCTFASAFTAFHAFNNSYPEAFRRTIDFMVKVIADSQNTLACQGTGPLLHYTQK